MFGLALARRLTHGPRVVATAGWFFPVYSHTFVYQELTQLITAGFAVRLLYGSDANRRGVSSHFRALTRVRRRFSADPFVCDRSVRYFEKKHPDRVTRLFQMLAQATGASEADLRHHHHVRQGFAFARQIESFRPHYVHSYFFYQDTLYALVASVLLNVPRGVTCYADHMLQDYELKVVPLHLRQCALVVATSARIKAELMAIAPDIPASRIIVKPNAIDSTRFLRSRQPTLRVRRPTQLLTVCRLDSKKGLLEMLSALADLRDVGFDAEWWVAGGVDGDASRVYLSQLQERISELRLESMVHLLGPQDQGQVADLLLRADVFVAPFVETPSGDKDGIPTALLEAMAAGVPVVVTDAGSIAEVVTSGQNGVMVPQRDSRALAAAIQSLANDPPQRLRLGNAGRETVRTRFDVTVCEPVLHAAIRRVASQSALGEAGIL